MKCMNLNNIVQHFLHVGENGNSPMEEKLTANGNGIVADF